MPDRGCGRTPSTVCYDTVLSKNYAIADRSAGIYPRTRYTMVAPTERIADIARAVFWPRM
jgi:hypothetical protein